MNWGNLVVQPGLSTTLMNWEKLGSVHSPTNISKSKLLCHMPYWKTILTVWQKNEGKRTSKIPIFKYFSELGNIWQCSLGFWKIPTHFSNELRKTWKYTQPNQHFKIQILNLLMNWERFESKMGNLHKKDGHVLNLT